MQDAYNKLWKSIPEQLQKLQLARLIIEDVAEAENFLRHLNYYRFSGYGLPFEVKRHHYIDGTTFLQIRRAYEFDRALRDLVYEAMEVIELDVRTSIAFTFGESYEAFGHIHPSNFNKRFRHRDWLQKLHKQTEASQEVFIRHFERKYSDYPNLPIWVVTEILSFGSLSMMLKGLHKKDQKRVAHRYGMQPETFISCLHHIVYVRNICAHHARLWDKIWAVKPQLPFGKAWRSPLLPSNRNLFASLLLQNCLLSSCDAERVFVAGWRDRIENLVMNQLPECPNALGKMGLTKNWTEHPLWI